MDKKRILIFSHALELGGAERALIGLLETVDFSCIQVDLFLMRHEGELMYDIPERVCLLPEVPAYTVLARPMKQTLKEGHLLLTALRMIARYKARHFVEKHQLDDNGVGLEYSHKYTWRLLPNIQPDVEYDLAISFLTPHYIVAHHVKAKKKICWIHTDYSSIVVDATSELKMWDYYDTIIAISEAVRRSFVKVFPTMEKKVLIIENTLPKGLIKRQAEEAIQNGEMQKGSVKLLSIGRFSYAKNFDNIPDICSRIRAAGLDVFWYLIGFGGDEEIIRTRIQESGMQEYVVILGKKDNPYPYIRNCDLYVQPSRYEGKCVAVREAQLLGKPVVITNYTTSVDQLEDGVDGVVVPMSNEECADGIVRLLEDPQKMKQLSETCRCREYANVCEAEKLWQIGI